MRFFSTAVHHLVHNLRLACWVFHSLLVCVCEREKEGQREDETLEKPGQIFSVSIRSATEVSELQEAPRPFDKTHECSW